MALEQRPDLLNLVLPRFHEPKDHADVGNALRGHRRWQAGEEIPVAAEVRTHAGGQRDSAGRAATVDWGAGDRGDVVRKVAQEWHVMIGDRLPDRELADERVGAAAVGRDKIANSA